MTVMCWVSGDSIRLLFFKLGLGCFVVVIIVVVVFFVFCF